MIRGPFLLEVAWYASLLHARQHPLSVACTCGDAGTLDAHVRFRVPQPLLHLDVANSLPFSSLSRGSTETQLHKLATMFTFSGKYRLFVFPSLLAVSFGGLHVGACRGPVCIMSQTHVPYPTALPIISTQHQALCEAQCICQLVSTRSEPLRMLGCKLCCACSSVCWTFHTCFV